MNYRVTAPSGLNIRSGPSKESEDWGDLPFGFEGEAIGETFPGWLAVELDDGTIGYISKEWTEPMGEMRQEGPQKPQEPPWLTMARGEVGVHEISGSEDNSRILEYHQATSLKATDDETPWCAAFACWCLEQAGVRSPRSAAAISFMDWGVPVTDPQPGDLAVFSRSGGNHVAFFLSRSGGSIKVLGGNQSDEVNVSYQNASRLRGYRRPA